MRLLPGGRRDAPLPPAHGSFGRADRARGGVLQGERALARARRVADVLAGGRARPLLRRAVARGAPPSAGSRAAARGEARVPRHAAQLRGGLRERARRGRRRDLPGERPARVGRRRATSAERGDADSLDRAAHRPRRAHVRRGDVRRRDLPPRSRCRRDRRDHVVHEHVESRGHGGRRAPCEEGGRARALTASRG